jgi:hypothetical protein
VLYPIGAGEILLSPFGLSNMMVPLDFDLTICETSIPSNYELSSLSFMDFEFPLDEVILEAMIMDLQPPPKLETL